MAPHANGEEPQVVHIREKAVPENSLKILGLWQLKEDLFLIEDNREGRNVQP